MQKWTRIAKYTNDLTQILNPSRQYVISADCRDAIYRVLIYQLEKILHEKTRQLDQGQKF
ncbi:hypothetical protein [Anabaena sp. CCY 0017]|uniref:hypothetical protein n=1 Tax=Anabaena sp. CCY 0017 TaxID=3103866 RepID=UPI0039C67BDE